MSKVAHKYRQLQHSVMLTTSHEGMGYRTPNSLFWIIYIYSQIETVHSSRNIIYNARDLFDHIMRITRKPMFVDDSSVSLLYGDYRNRVKSATMPAGLDQVCLQA